jgi:hypothetical protein
MSENRELLIEMGLDESIVFENPSYDSAIIGYDEITQRVVYDYEKMVECLVKEDGMEYDEAMEFIDYNTIRACPYMGENAPIILKKID